MFVRPLFCFARGPKKQYVRKSTDFHKFVDALGMPFGLGFHADSIEQANAFLDVRLALSLSLFFCQLVVSLFCLPSVSDSASFYHAVFPPHFYVFLLVSGR